ncbi:FAD-dependent oxidoreductase [Umezawaea endophytica]|uniref:FAD-dependent oxidoreductase n=1 Tax=Umezawaea endophytica TaxID=1654476 RepID=A0A9X2VMB5_9PSEU|nr:FAD-dependent oxidoreductase [Umezawaea endophytica]MCS7478749.1 FAD-dependent oxidoreductase [Umezawaea endophytica]
MKICVVGSGISGLAAAHYLTDHPGHSVTVLEAASQFGGRANVTPDGEHGPRIFLADYHYLLGLLREIPAGGRSVRDALRKCRRFAGRSDGTWVEIDHIHAFLARTRGLSARDRFSIAKSDWHAKLVARRNAQSSNIFGLIWNRSDASPYRAMASSRRETRSYALPGSTEEFLLDPWIAFLRSRGVQLRSGCRVKLVRPRIDDVQIVTNSGQEQFDAVIFTGFVHDAYDLLDRSGIARPLDCRRHTHRKAFTIDLDPREKVLASGDVQIYAGAGITTVVQPDENRCVTLAAIPRSTGNEFVLEHVRGQLELAHEPRRVRTRTNWLPGEAVFTGEYVDPLRIEQPLQHRVYFAGSYTDNSYPLDSAEGACRSAYYAVARLAKDHDGVTLRSGLGLPSAVQVRRASPSPRAHPNAPAHTRLDSALRAMVSQAAVRLVPLVSDVVFEEMSGCSWPLAQAAVYVANHRSVFDVLAGVLAFRHLRVSPRLVVARKYFDKGVSAKILYAIGALPALRGSDATVNAGIAAIRAGDSVAIMPEGRITAVDDVPGAGYGRGAAMMAIETGAPIVPIGSSGTHLVWKNSRPWPLVNRDRPRVTIVIGRPIDPTGLSCQELTDRIRQAVCELEVHAERGVPAGPHVATA